VTGPVPPAAGARQHVPTYGVLLRARSGAELVVDVPLGHGQDPEVLLTRAGWRVERPVAACREGAGVGRVVIEYAVRAASPCAPPQRLLGPEPVTMRRPVGETVDVPDPGVAAITRQRVSAAALVLADVPPGVRDSLGRRGPGGPAVLATRYSGAALRWDGAWGLPGGGLDEGEEPVEAARRESYEETGQDVTIGELAFVQSAHWVGRSPAGVLEDFHAVRLVYRGHCAEPGDVAVLDAGGTTAQAAWVPLGRAAQVEWAPGPAEQLQALGVLP